MSLNFTLFEINSKWIGDPNVEHETKTSKLLYNLEVRKASQKEE